LDILIFLGHTKTVSEIYREPFGTHKLPTNYVSNVFIVILPSDSFEGVLPPNTHISHAYGIDMEPIAVAFQVK